ncbi:Stearoyl-CoA desaturase [Taphrina deformans PYCC 5710]|uniref:Stearoyl-CoA desaturase n=1 Tax=Taphrina deformans (strain PYCC 5710 / ATCC 11124 / CBS 356.35 / IMI 108563 / JCM 9778 / NBRC 8474) TaxID=1097556 RepID=R4X7E4_TAPDE|nr:Stearoyl-CoA desaturase [Taphrina deformans PYCC 5710]|eukprot:CCG81290.1 Stearoyl-CoA desaturase [Taphrina deformans PYCC 5710]
MPLRIVLAIMGTMAFQGSIKWWVIRHRLHHRYTDTDSDPYSAEKGLFHSHMGWIFVKPHYPKLKLIDKSDLNADIIVRLQHKFFLPMSLLYGFVLPAIIGKLWFNDAWMGLLWGGMVARIAIWHCTFLINSLAHYIGDQFYSTDVSARGNFILAMLTNGEGFHNYHHAFPCDYRNGIKALDWDPTKWIVYLLHQYTALVPSIRKISARDIDRARARVALSHSPLAGYARTTDMNVDLPRMTLAEAKKQFMDKPVVVIEGYVVEVGAYAEEHPGGEGLLRAHYGAGDATKAFLKLNNHTAHARGLVEDFRIAEIV